MTYLLIPLFLLPGVTFAAGLTNSQINAVLGLLQAFSVPQQLVWQIESELRPPVAPAQPDPLEVSVDMVKPELTNGVFGALIHFTTNKTAYAKVNVYQKSGPIIGTYYPNLEYSQDASVHVPNLDTAKEYLYTLVLTSGGESTTTSGSFQI